MNKGIWGCTKCGHPYQDENDVRTHKCAQPLVKLACPGCGATEEDGLRVQEDTFKTAFPNPNCAFVDMTCDSCNKAFEVELVVKEIREIGILLEGNEKK